jgi:hypothetical protein
MARVFAIAVLLLFSYVGIAVGGPISASASQYFAGGWGILTSQVSIRIDMAVDTPRIPRIGVPGTEILNLTLGEADAGRTIAITPTTPSFAAFAESLTSVDTSYARLTWRSREFGALGYIENSEFEDSNGQPVDLSGQPIASINLHISDIRFTSPGYDPNHSGVWTDVNLRYTVTVNIVPEPSSIALFGLGIAVVVVGGRRSQTNRTRRLTR